MKIIIEKHSDGYCGYQLGFSNGAIVGQGNTYMEALQSVEGSIKAFIDYYCEIEFKQHFIDDYKIDYAYIAEIEAIGLYYSIVYI